jgi:gamma-glutamyltranspeptidase/glutathione hydrolase
VTADGFVLNNEMDDFSSPGQVNAFGFAASPINFIAGGKRPQSSIASSIVEDLETGELLMATGSAGGSRIITTTLQELYHYMDQGLNATECTGQCVSCRSAVCMLIFAARAGTIS